jgi:dTDP-4-amino-4,6-dideoxygalactose transaminase
MAARAWPFWKTIPRFDREYSLGDLFQAVGTIAGGGGPDATGLEQFVSLGGSLYLARSGRESLYLILRMLDLPPSSRVGVPLYCCASVFEAIVVAGHVPVFLDIDLETYSVRMEHLERRMNQIDALIIVHTFGYPADIDQLRERLGTRPIPVIEDCAHALFTECGSRLAGSHTEAAFFTFGMHKPAAVGGGAALLINNRSLEKKAACEVARLRAETLPRELRHSLACWARGLSYQRATYGALLGSPLGRYRDEERLHSNGNGGGTSGFYFPPSKIRSVDRVLLRQRISDFRAKLPALAVNTQKLREAISATTLAMPSEPLFGTWNHFMVPVRYQTAKQREVGRAFLKRKRIDSAPLYQNCARNARRFGYEGGCPNAEHAAQTVCTIPNHAWLSEDEIGYLGESLGLSSNLTSLS